MNSEMITVGGNYSGGDGASMYKCTAQNHQFERNRLMAMNPRKRKLLIQEKQPVNTEQQPVWVYPQVWQRLREKYPNNLQITICSLLTALAGDATIIVEAEYAAEMKQLAAQHGMKLDKGRELLALLRANIEMTRQMEEVRIQQKVLEPFLKVLGAAAGTGQVPAQQQPASQTEPAPLPPRSQLAAPLQFNDLGEAADAEGNYVEQEDPLTALAPLTQVPAASTQASSGSGYGGQAMRPGGLPMPTPQRER